MNSPDTTSTNPTVQRIPLVYVSLKARMKSSNIKNKTETEGIIAKSGAENGAALAIQKRLPDSITELVRKPWKGLYDKLNRFANIDGKFAIPMFAPQKDGTKKHIWMEIEQSIEESKRQMTAGIEAIKELFRNGELQRRTAIHLNGLYDASKLPQSEAEIDEWYGMDIEITHTPTAEVAAYLDTVQPEAKERFLDTIETTKKAIAKREADAMRKPLVKHVADMLESIAKNASDDLDKPQWGRVFTKIDKILSILPAFNVDGNEETSRLIDELHAKFGNLKDKADQLRNSPATVKDVFTQVRETQAKFSELF